MSYYFPAYYSTTSQPKTINLITRAGAGDIGSNFLKNMARMLALSNFKEGNPVIKLYAIVRSLKNLDGYLGAIANRTNRGSNRVQDTLVFKQGIDNPQIPSINFVYKDGVVGQSVHLTDNINKIPKADKNILIDCTGQDQYKTIDDFRKLSGADRVIFSAPIKSIPKNQYVPTKAAHINTDKLEDFPIISAASCTTNGAASMLFPILKNIPIKKINKIELLTLHEATGSQKVLDTTSNDAKKKQSLSTAFDTTTGAAIALKKVLPEYLDKKDIIFNAKAIRVPIDGSQIDLDLEIELKPGQTLTKDMIIKLFNQNHQYKKELMQKIKEGHGRINPQEAKKIFEKRNQEINPTVELTTRKDINTRHILNTEVTAVVKKNSIQVNKLPYEGNVYQIKLSGYYDNVIGYSAQLADLTAMYINKYEKTNIPMLERTSFWNVTSD